ncbi:MAG TPA: NAD(P)-dependent oxidoreductase [Nitrospirales bacterium]|jgi:3-hydroxyisobutyrate dehydrogenase
MLPETALASTRIGWVGLGVMGAPMCGHLLRQGYSLTVFTRTPAKAAQLLSEGAKWAESPAAVAQQSDVVFTMVGFPEDVREVYFGGPGLLKGAHAGTLLVDMTTTAPSLAREIFEASSARGMVSIDAPVSGGDVGAKSATLSIMVGGEQKTVDTIMPMLRALGRSIVYQGGPGMGQHAKLCNQIVIAGTMVGVCESLLYGYKAGLNLETMLASISAGAAACWTLTNLAPRILERNFDPGFMVDHFLKDMAIALDEARRMKLALPGLGLVQQLYLAVQSHGYGKCGTHALILGLERLSNTEVPR